MNSAIYVCVLINLALAMNHFAITMKSQSHFLTTRGPILLTWINFNPSMYNHMPSKVRDEITNPLLNFNGCTVKV